MVSISNWVAKLRLPCSWSKSKRWFIWISDEYHKYLISKWLSDNDQHKSNRSISVKIIAKALLPLAILIFTGCAAPNRIAETRPTEWSQKVELNGLSNIYKIDDHVYRSEQPHVNGMKSLQEQGIKSVLNLRSVRNDNREAKGTALTLYHIPINTWRMSYEDLLKSVVILQTAEKPVLVHCLHGSDRTGCVIAAYRMIQYGWTKEEAIKELVEGGYGYHEKWFPNILELINSLDVEKLKKDVHAASGL